MKVLITVAVGALTFAACAQPTLVRTVDAGAPPSSASVEKSKWDRYPLGICHTKGVKLRETPVAASEMTKEEVVARHAGKPTIVVHGSVTVSKNAYAAPTDDGSVARTAKGRSLRDVSAWILVDEDVRIPLSGGGAVEGESAGDSAYFTAQASVLDGQSGESLYGWTCASRFEYGDGSTVTNYGVDPDIREQYKSGPIASEPEPATD